MTLTFDESMGLVDIVLEDEDLTGGGGDHAYANTTPGVDGVLNVHVLAESTPGVDAVTAASGTFLLMIEGLTAQIAYNVTAAALQTELQALLGTPSVTCACSEANLGVNSAVMTLTFDENFANGAPIVEIDTASMAGNLHVLAASDAGTELLDANVIRGFVAHSNVQLSATDEVQGDIMVTGEIHAADANTSTIRALCTGSPSEAELNTALKGKQLRDAGILIRGLADAIV
jgi:hypothetical protein